MAPIQETVSRRVLGLGGSRAFRLSSAAGGLALALLMAAGTTVGQVVPAGSTASHQVTVRVEAVSALVLNGGDIQLVIPTPPDGGSSSATDASCSLDWMTNQDGQKVTVATNLSHPRLRLTVEALSPRGGHVTGPIVLAPTPQDLVVDLVPGIGGCGLKYVAETGALEQPIPDVHIVTYTLTSLR